MTHPETDKAIELLRDMLAIPTVNPMGRPYEGTRPVERPLIEYIERLFAPLGVSMRRQTCSPIHESLLIVIPGQVEGPFTLLESHMDTVPADDWPDRAFVPRVEGNIVYGRGACDDKGSLASMVLAVLDVLQSGERPPQPVWLLAAGDEEHEQSGIKHFFKTCNAPVGRAIFGEPTEVLPVIQHKGTIRWDITVHGRSAHASCPELGRNAILDMVSVIEKLAEHQHDLRRRYVNPRMTGPALTVTQIEGGRTRNAVPDQCTIAVDFRIIPGMDRTEATDDLFRLLDTLDVELTHGDFQCFAPPLDTSPRDPFTETVVDFCRRHLGRDVQPLGEPYGSDACWMPEGKPAIVLGPGSIEHAHAIDERVDAEQVVRCAAVLRAIMLHDWA